MACANGAISSCRARAGGRADGPWGRRVNDTAADVRQVLRYGREKVNRKWLAIGLVLIAIGVGFAFWQPGGFKTYDWFMTGLAFVLGLFMTGYAAFRMLAPGKPLLTLSPDGLRLTVEWVKTIRIPWHEVKGVDTIDIAAEFRGTRLDYHGVTVVLVSQAFYDRHIHIRSWFLRGPGWDFNFVPKGRLMQVALHHEVLPVDGPALRAAVEARWLAFRGDKRATSVPLVPP